MKILETRISIKLGGEDRVMLFNANTFAAYEEATGKFFLDTAATLFDAMKPFLEARKARALRAAGATEDLAVPDTTVFDVLRKVSIKDLRALLWASLHVYDAHGEPSWPLTVHEVGRLLRPADIPPIFTAFLNGQAANSPTAEEVGESKAPPRKLFVNGAPPREADDGGERSTELPQGAFDFANRTSGG